MRIKLKALRRKLLPYLNSFMAKVHNRDLLMKEYHRKADWKYAVLYACDNMREYFPVGCVHEWDPLNEREVKFPSRKSVPNDVANFMSNQRYYHIIQTRKNRLKIVRLKY